MGGCALVRAVAHGWLQQVRRLSKMSLGCWRASHTHTRPRTYREPGQITVYFTRWWQMQRCIDACMHACAHMISMRGWAWASPSSSQGLGPRAGGYHKETCLPCQQASRTHMLVYYHCKDCKTGQLQLTVSTGSMPNASAHTRPAGKLLLTARLQGAGQAAVGHAGEKDQDGIHQKMVPHAVQEDMLKLCQRASSRRAQRRAGAAVLYAGQFL